MSLLDDYRDESSRVDRYCDNLKRDLGSVESDERGGDSKVDLWIFDTHFPEHDESTWRIFLQAIVDINPHRIGHGGDILNWESLSPHSKLDKVLDLQGEYDIGDAHFGQIEDAIEAAAAKHGHSNIQEKVVIQGNHEYWFDRWLQTKCPSEVRSHIRHPKEGLGLDRRGWTWVSREDQPYEIGDLDVHHGKSFGVHHAMTQLKMWRASQLYGHTHRPQQVALWNGRETQVVTGAPCACKIERSWDHLKKICDWTNGFVVVEWMGDAHHAYNVLVRDGSAAYGRHRWWA